MSEIYTSGIWIVKPGFEEQFKQTWLEFAQWTKSQFDGAISVVLLQDTGDPRRFVSVGPWRSQDDIDAWRASGEFGSAVARLRPMLESFQPATLIPACKVE